MQPLLSSFSCSACISSRPLRAVIGEILLAAGALAEDSPFEPPQQFIGHKPCICLPSPPKMTKASYLGGLRLSWEKAPSPCLRLAQLAGREWKRKKEKKAREKKGTKSEYKEYIRSRLRVVIYRGLFIDARVEKIERKDRRVRGVNKPSMPLERNLLLLLSIWALIPTHAELVLSLWGRRA